MSETPTYPAPYTETTTQIEVYGRFASIAHDRYIVPVANNVVQGSIKHHIPVQGSNWVIQASTDIPPHMLTRGLPIPDPMGIVHPRYIHLFKYIRFGLKPISLVEGQKPYLFETHIELKRLQEATREQRVIPLIGVEWIDDAAKAKATKAVKAYIQEAIHDGLILAYDHHDFHADVARDTLSGFNRSAAMRAFPRSRREQIKTDVQAKQTKHVTIRNAIAETISILEDDYDRLIDPLTDPEAVLAKYELMTGMPAAAFQNAEHEQCWGILNFSAETINQDVNPILVRQYNALQKARAGHSYNPVFAGHIAAHVTKRYKVVGLNPLSE